MIFLVTFAMFSIILTVTENIFLALIAGIIVIIFCLIYKKFRKKDLNFWKSAGIIGLAFIISLLSIFVKNYTYNQKIETISTFTGLITQNADGPQGEYFVGTGIISDIYSYQKYIFQDNAGREYFLKSKKSYEIGDVIRLNGYVSLGYTGSYNIFDLKNQLDFFRQKHESATLFYYEFNYPKWEMMKGYFGTITEQQSILIDDSGKGIGFIQKCRQKLQNAIISSYGKSHYAGLVLGMLVGDRSQITSEDYQGFIDSGLVHIIAVSGGNIVMIVVFLSAILFFLPFYIRNGIILLTIILYAMICGLDSSVFRATIMGGLSLFAIFWGREIDIWRAMAIAFIVMLVINPYFLAYDVGFLLSFSAIIGIVYFSQFITKILEKKKNSELSATKTTQNIRKKPNSKLKKFGNKAFLDYIVPTIGATLGVLPIMLFFMGGTNLLSIIANFFVSPIIAIVMIYGFISTILFTIIPWNLRLLPEKFLIDYIYLISDTTVNWGLYLQAVGAWLKYTLLTLFILWILIQSVKK